MNFSDYDFSYLIPPKEVLDVQHDDYYIQHGEGSTSVRKVFDCVPYNDFEKQKLKEFEDMIQKEGLQLPARWTRAYTMRFVYSAKFALDKCMENLKTYLDWYSKPARKTMTPRVLELLKEGLVYLAGRDKQFRPVFVINVEKLDMKKMSMDDFCDTLCALCAVLEEYCFVPGKVENWVIIIETNNVGMWSFPFKILQNLVTITSIAFTSTLDKLYIMNPPRLLKASWSMIQKLVHPETAAKISMIDKSEYPQLLEKISIDQLEERYGGKLPKLDVYWPPRNSLNKTPYRKPNEPRRPDLNNNKRESLVPKSATLRDPQSANALANSVYYDFDTIIEDIPEAEQNKMLKSPHYESEKGGNGIGTTAHSFKSPGQYSDTDIILERKMVKSRCCRVRRDSDSASSCNMF